MKEFKAKFKVSEYLIRKVGGWNISVRPMQITIGSLVLSLDRKCEKLGDLSEIESRDLGEAFKLIDQLLGQTFKPDQINYLALMMVDKQVHFHVIPRYEKVKEFCGQWYSDKSWPGPPDLTCDSIILNEQLMELKVFLCNSVKTS